MAGVCLGMDSKLGEAEGDFRARLSVKGREERDAAVEKMRDRSRFGKTESWHPRRDWGTRSEGAAASFACAVREFGDAGGGDEIRGT